MQVTDILWMACVVASTKLAVPEPPIKITREIMEVDPTSNEATAGAEANDGGTNDASGSGGTGGGSSGSGGGNSASTATTTAGAAQTAADGR